MRVSRLALVNNICKQVRVTRKNPKSEDLTKRELMHIDSYLRLQIGNVQDMEKRIVELEAMRMPRAAKD